MPPRISNAPRGSRHSSPSVRGPSRGGIQKRQSGAKTDKDGDISMDGIAARGSGSKGPRGRGSSGRAEYNSSSGSSRAKGIARGLSSHQANILETRISHSPHVQLSVQGLKKSKVASNPYGGLPDLVRFLERKANAMDPKRAVRITKSVLDGDLALITASQEDATRILKLNTFVFAGSALTIEQITSPAPGSGKEVAPEALSTDAKNTQERIKGILSTLYNPTDKLLNLSALGQNPDLQAMGMFDAKNRITKLFPVLMVVCDRIFESPKAKRDAITSITLANNQLENISNVTSLAQTFPDLENLDLSGNNFADLRSFEGWRWRFRKLKNLIIANNPIENTTTVPDYKQEIIKWFPLLQTLNNIQVRSAEEIAAVIEAEERAKQLAHVSPIPILGSDWRDVQTVGERFLEQVYSAHNDNRALLADMFYDAQSTFSLSVNVSAPRSADAASHQQAWAPWIKHSRNLYKITNLPTRMSRAYRGVEAIKAVWTELPTTSHPDIRTQGVKYLVDCHLLPGLTDPSGQNPRGVDGLILMVHGEFQEQDPSGSPSIARSFSRTFILGPAPPGRPFEFRVVSDVLKLRAYSPLATMTADTPAPTTTANTESADLARREEMGRQLVLRTHLTPHYALLCLEASGWDLEKAFVTFEQNKANLGQEAFDPALVSA